MMEQSYYSPSTSSISNENQSSLGDAASEFARNVQEATGKLVAAGEQFTSMSAGLDRAIAEVKAAASRAEEARNASEAVQMKMERDYANLSGVIRDLQERIGALAVLARPLVSAGAAPDAIPAEEPTENQGEGSVAVTATSSEQTPSPAGWQGWQG